MRRRVSWWMLLPLLALASLLLAVTLPASEPAKSAPLVVLSVTDVKGKTSPCGCHIPKGGLSRQAAFVDSMRTLYDQVVFVDGGGFFPDDESQSDIAIFLMDAMKTLGMEAVGVSEHELLWGISFLKAQVRRSGLPVTSANLMDAATHAPVFPPYVIEKVGKVKVGFFSLMSDKVDLGLAKDSLKVDAPEAAARRTVDELRKKGVTVVVLLSQVGNILSENLVANVPGIDAVICGHGTPLIEKGRMVKNTIASYGGEQGQYMSRTLINLDSRGKMTGGDNESFMLSPEVGEKPAMYTTVKAFEDQRNERLRVEEARRAAVIAAKAGQDTTSRFVGMGVCASCHVNEAAQWKTTAHSLAWQSLVNANKDATPECVTCHVVGYRQPGGYQTGADSGRLANVQCENCHGFGSAHQGGAHKMAVIGESTCMKCHNSERDPDFDYAKKRAMIVHDNLSGESVRSLQSHKGNGSMH